MEANILKESKDSLEVELESVTLAELLKVYLNKDSKVEFAVWKREHPTKNPVLSLKTKGKTAKKAVNDAVSGVVKDLDGAAEDFKKLK